MGLVAEALSEEGIGFAANDGLGFRVYSNIVWVHYNKIPIQPIFYLLN